MRAQLPAAIAAIREENVRWKAKLALRLSLYPRRSRLHAGSEPWIPRLPAEWFPT